MSRSWASCVHKTNSLASHRWVHVQTILWTHPPNRASTCPGQTLQSSTQTRVKPRFSRILLFAPGASRFAMAPRRMAFEQCIVGGRRECDGSSPVWLLFFYVFSTCHPCCHHRSRSSRDQTASLHIHLQVSSVRPWGKGRLTTSLHGPLASPRDNLSTGLASDSTRQKYGVRHLWAIISHDRPTTWSAASIEEDPLTRDASEPALSMN